MKSKYFILFIGICFFLILGCPEIDPYGPDPSWDCSHCIDYSEYLARSDSSNNAFHFPPPVASAFYLLPDQYFRSAWDLSDIDSLLSRGLSICGYNEKSYFEIPEGFVLITRLERINNDASPHIRERWTTGASYVGYESFSLSKYLRSLFYADPGKFRVLAFVVTSIPFNPTDLEISFQEASEYSQMGLKWLPDQIGSEPFTYGHNCTALIYEFLKPQYEEARFIHHSRYQGIDHLTKNNFLSNLRSIR